MAPINNIIVITVTIPAYHIREVIKGPIIGLINLESRYACNTVAQATMVTNINADKITNARVDHTLTSDPPERPLYIDDLTFVLSMKISGLLTSGDK